MFVSAAVMLVVLLVELPAWLRQWDPRERWVFAALWAATFTWTAISRVHGTPGLPALTDRLFRRLGERLLRPQPNIFW